MVKKIIKVSLDDENLNNAERHARIAELEVERERIYPNPEMWDELSEEDKNNVFAIDNLIEWLLDEMEDE